MDQLSGRANAQRLVSLIERNRRTVETNAVATRLNQELITATQTAIQKGSDTFNLVPIITNNSAVSGQFTLGDFGPDAAINDNGDIAFITGAGPFGLGTGVYKVSGATVTPLALANQLAPLTGGGHFLGFLDVIQSPGGSVIFTAAIEGGVTTGGVFRVLGNAVYPVALAGQQVGSDVLTNIGAIAVSSNGLIAFNATVNAVDNNGNVLGSGTAVFTFAGDQLNEVARSGQVVNGINNLTQLSSVNNTNSPAGQSAISINSSGVVVFTAVFMNPNTTTGTALFKAFNGNVTAIAASQQTATTGTVYTNNGLIGPVFLSDSNVLAYTGQFSIDPNDFAPHSGLFVAQPSQAPTLVIKSGDAVPGLPAGFIFDGVGGAAFISLAGNNSGNLAFIAKFSNLQSSLPFGTGVFTLTNFSASSLSLISKDLVTGGPFNSFTLATLGGAEVTNLARSLSINSSGTIAFTNESASGASQIDGVFTSTGGSRVTDQTALPNTPTLIDFHDTKVNSSGSIVFSAAIVGGLPGLFLSQGATLTPLAMIKGTAPGTGTVFTGLGDAVIDNNNRVAFTGTYNLGGGPSMGVFLSSGGTTNPLAIVGQTLGPSEVVNAALFPGFGANGSIVFLADNSATGNQSKDKVFNSSIFSASGSSFTRLVNGAITSDIPPTYPGDAAPGTGGAKLVQMETLATNGNDVAFEASTSTGGLGLFQISSGAATAIAVPPAGADFISDLSINVGKQVSFDCGEQIDDSTILSNPGLFSISSGVRSLLVTRGDQIPGSTDQLLPVFLSNNLADSGKIVFTAIHSSFLNVNSAVSFSDERAAGLSTFLIPAGQNPDNGGHLSVVATNGSFIQGTAGTVAASIGSAISPNGNIIVTAIVHGSIDMTDAILSAQPNTLPAIQVTQPATGNSVGAGLPTTIKWSATDDVGLIGFDINLSTNGGATFTNIGHAFGFSRNFSWRVPGNLIGTTNDVIQVVAFDTAGGQASANSGAFAVKPGGPTISTFSFQRGATTLKQVNAGTDDLLVTLTGNTILAGAQVFATDSLNNQTQVLVGSGSSHSVTATIPKALIAQPKTLLLSVVNPGTAPSAPVSVAVNGPKVTVGVARKVFNNSTLIGYDVTLTGTNLTPADLQPFTPAATVKNGINPVAVSNIVAGNNSLTIQIRTTFSQPTVLSIQAGYTGVTGANVLAKSFSVNVPQ